MPTPTRINVGQALFEDFLEILKAETGFKDLGRSQRDFEVSSHEQAPQTDYGLALFHPGFTERGDGPDYAALRLRTHLGRPSLIRFIASDHDAQRQPAPRRHIDSLLKPIRPLRRWISPLTDSN